MDTVFVDIHFKALLWAHEIDFKSAEPSLKLVNKFIVTCEY